MIEIEYNPKTERPETLIIDYEEWDIMEYDSYKSGIHASYLVIHREGAIRKVRLGWREKSTKKRCHVCADGELPEVDGGYYTLNPLTHIKTLTTREREDNVVELKDAELYLTEQSISSPYYVKLI